MAANTLAADLDQIIQQLSLPVSACEAEYGWTAPAKSGIASYFRKQRECLTAGRKLGKSGLIRGLDAWGVSGGKLYEMALRINRELLS